MSPVALIVNLQSRGWQAAWYRQVMVGWHSPPMVVTAESLHDCSQHLRQWPRSWLALEVRAETMSDDLRWIAQSTRDFPHLAVGVLVDRTLSRWTAVFREAGAAHCCDHLPELGNVASMVRRHISHVSSAVPSDPWTEIMAAASVWPSDADKLSEMFDAR